MRPGSPAPTIGAGTADNVASSAANVGSDKDSEKRQRDAIATFATRAGYTLVDVFYDTAVSGADAIDSRPGFAAMLKRSEGNGVKTIIVETASRFARDLMVQEVGHAMLRSRGIDLIAADNPGSFLDDTSTAKLVHQVLGGSTGPSAAAAGVRAAISTAWRRRSSTCRRAHKLSRAATGDAAKH
jgi:DNA invertase Pin-like site-specific DNA recombinase